ncbi:phage shock protein PspD [Mangrovibacter phragmitis]|nr:phage shock protein PspD [Mangrovibacter phragmitis]
MLATTVALRFVPAGVATLVISRVAHKPLRLLLGVALEPVLRTCAKKFTQRWHNNPDV